MIDSTAIETKDALKDTAEKLDKLLEFANASQGAFKANLRMGAFIVGFFTILGIIGSAFAWVTDHIKH